MAILDYWGENYESMMKILCFVFVAFLFCGRGVLTSHQLNHSQCNRLIIVDINDHYCGDLSHLTVHNCGSLKKVFQFFQEYLNTPYQEEDNCTEVVLKEGEHVIEGISETVIHHSLFLHSCDGERAKVILITAANMETRSLLSFAQTKSVIMDGIEFISIRSDSIRLDLVKFIRITNSSFR